MISEYTLIDTQGCSHALQLHEDRLLLDQQPVLTIQQAAVIVFVISEGQEQGQEIACTPQACWDAFAGAGAIPTAAEAGRLLADHLAHWIDEQRLRVFLQAFIGDRAPALLLPQPRLDPFVEAALSRCEPTPTLAKVEALAQVQHWLSEGLLTAEDADRIYRGQSLAQQSRQRVAVRRAAQHSTAQHNIT